MKSLEKAALGFLQGFERLFVGAYGVLLEE